MKFIDGPIKWEIIHQDGEETYSLELQRGWGFVLSDGVDNRHLAEVLDDIVEAVNTALEREEDANA